jgi:CRP/FNR family cyclic AMP-dependent transcriptional regulator
MPADASFLQQIQLFAQLDDDERTVLAQQMAERTVKAGESLFRIGDPGDSMFIVSTGKVELFVKDTAGQKIVLHNAVTGDFFGELSLLDGGSRTASATALDETFLFVLDREDLLQLFKKRPEAALDMLAAMGRMTRKANALLRERVSKNVNEQVEEERSNLILRIADTVANFSGSLTFLVVHIFFFAFWLSFNGNLIPGLHGFDPFPFNLLTMCVSLEAIILSTLLLFSSNRQGARDRIRADVEYEINMKAELEVAHLHEKTDKIYEEMGERFMRIEKALNIARSSGQQPAASPKA